MSVVSVLTFTVAPFVPDWATSCFAFARSGAVHLLPGFFVYGQYGLKPGKFGGRIWQVGTARLGPPWIFTSAFRSVARFTAWRAFRLSNGFSRTLNAK